MRNFTIFIERLVAACCIDNSVTKKFNNLGCTVLTALQLEQRRCFFYKSSVALAGSEGFVVDNIDQERYIRLDTSDTQFLQSTERFADSTFKSTVMCDDFYKKAVIVWKNFCTCVSIAAVETDTIT